MAKSLRGCSLVVLAFTATWAPGSFPAESFESAQRPRVGLVLSGGGARGAAHAGVIRVLEENRIPIDVITGTSMGAIVGGLYASGMTAEEISHTLRTLDWDELLNDRSDRALRPYRRKVEDTQYLLDAEPGYRDGKLQLPPGLITGQKIQLFLEAISLPVADINDFDKLPIPFRAIATDIVTGDAVVLGNGNLAKAMRASMAVPGAFAPVEHDGTLLVDGGVANNLPVDVARDMGADVLIVVDISTPLAGRDQIGNFLTIITQLTGLLTRKNTEHSLASLSERDVLIVPDLGDIGAADFDKANDAIPLGRQAALEQLDRLSVLSLSEAAYGRYRAGIQRITGERPIIEFVRIENHSRFSDAPLEKLFDPHIGAPLDVAALEFDIEKVYASDRFEQVIYHIVYEDERLGLEIDIHERSWGPNYIQGGLGFTADLSGSNAFTIAASYTKTGINPQAGEWRTVIQLGEERNASTEWFQYFDDNFRYFVNPKAEYASSNLSLFEDDHNIAETRIYQTTFGFDVGRELGTWGELRAGYAWTTGYTKLRIGDPTLPEDNFKDSYVALQLSVDTLDDRYFPKKGLLATLAARTHRSAFGGDSNYEQVEFSTAVAKTWGKNTWVFGGEYRTTLDDNAPFQSLFRLGGFLHLSGLEPNQLAGQHSARVAIAYYRRIGDFNLLPMYVGGTLEAGNVAMDRNDLALDDLLGSGSLFVSFDTPIGPLYIGFGHTHGGRDSAFLMLGQPF